MVNLELTSPEPISLIGSAPFLAVGLGVLILMLMDLSGILKSEFNRTALPVVFLFTAFVAVQMFHSEPENFFSGELTADTFGSFFASLILVSSAAVILMNHGSLEAQKVERPRDINLLILLSTIGAVGMVCSNGLISLFLSLELLSIPLYVLVSAARTERASTEGALKYFLLGALASSFLLYGMALLYAVTGTLQISQLAMSLQGAVVLHPLVLVSLSLILFGLAFKVGLAPFHFWIPDAYQGAPLSIFAYMSVVVKVAAFGALVRVFGVAFASFGSLWEGIVIFVGGLSMLVGNLAALRQRSIKRILAYSSIAQAGYAVVALPFMSNGGIEALVLYVAVYAVTSLGLAAVILSHLAGTENQYTRDNVESLKGLFQRDPLSALALAVFVLSLGGIPPLAGFYGKFFIITVALKSESPGVAIFLIVNSAISLFYYLRMVAAAFESSDQVQPSGISLIPIRVVTLTSALLVLFATLFIDPITSGASAAAAGLIEPFVPTF